jgi:hypothetical protein
MDILEYPGRLNIRIVREIFVNALHIEFQQNLQIELWHTWKSKFSALCKVGFIMN